MKKIAALLLFFGTSVSYGAPFCIQTFNAYGPAYAPDRDGRTQATVDEVATQTPCDVYQFQEVWVESHYELFSKLFSTEVPGLTSTRFDDLRKDPNRAGLANFVHGQVLDQTSFLFDKNEDGLLDWFRKMFKVKKGVGYQRVQLPTLKTPIQVFSLHLHPSSQEIRIQQVLQLGEWMNAHLVSGEPTFVTGDFNAAPDSMEWQLMRGVLGLDDATYVVNGKKYPADYCTYCKSQNPLSWGNGDRVYDYIFYRAAVGSWKVRPTSAQVNLRKHGATFLSDHFGLQARFEIE